MLTPAGLGIFSPLDRASTSSRVRCFGKLATLDAGAGAGLASFNPGSGGGCGEGVDGAGTKMGAAGTGAPMPKMEFGRVVVGGTGTSAAGRSSGAGGSRAGAAGRAATDG